MNKLIALAFCIWVCLLTGTINAQQNTTAAISKEEVLQKIAAAADDSTRAYWQLNMGRKLVADKEFDEAIGYFRKSLVYQERVKSWPGIAKCNANIAVCYTGMLDLQNALQYYETAEAAALKSGDNQILNTVYTGLLATNNKLGRSAKGLDYAHKLLAQGKASSDNSVMGFAYYNIGYFYHLNGNMDKAMQNYLAALNHYKRTNDATMIASLQINIGEYYATINQLDSAKIYYNRSLETAVKLNDKIKMSGLYQRLGNLYAIDGDYENLLKLSDQSLSLARELDNKELMAYYHFILEKAKFLKLLESVPEVDGKKVLNAAQQKDLKKTIDTIEVYVDNYRAATINYVELSGMAQTLFYMKQLAGDYEGALGSYMAYTAYKDSFSGAENMKQFASVEAKYAFEKSRDSLRLLEQQKRLELEKEMELSALKFEFEKKRALAKTEAERKQLLFEEEVKRKAIEAEYLRNRDAANSKYAQEKALAKANEEKERALSLAELRKSNNARNISLLGAGLLLVSAGVFGYGYSQKRRDNKKIASEKKRSDELLLNILPAEVAEELKNNGQSKAQQHPEVSVLFTDFVNFTQTSEKLGVEELVNELNINFTAFDRIMERHGLEKIKTIGDAYLAVSGLPVANERHAENAVKAALEIIRFVEKRKKEVPYGLDIRIGINSGALIAGIIGVKKFAYDIWGDTVNIAARMEQNGSPGKVNISESTYQLVKNDFACVYRGRIDAKNKGELDMYFVTDFTKK